MEDTTSGIREAEDRDETTQERGDVRRENSQTFLLWREATESVRSVWVSASLW